MALVPVVYTILWEEVEKITKRPKIYLSLGDARLVVTNGEKLATITNGEKLEEKVKTYECIKSMLVRTDASRERPALKISRLVLDEMRQQALARLKEYLWATIEEANDIRQVEAVMRYIGDVEYSGTEKVHALHRVLEKIDREINDDEKTKGASVLFPKCDWSKDPVTDGVKKKE